MFPILVSRLRCLITGHEDVLEVIRETEDGMKLPAPRMAVRCTNCLRLSEGVTVGSDR